MHPSIEIPNEILESEQLRDGFGSHLACVQCAHISECDEMNSLLGHKSSTQSSAVIKVDPSMAMLLAELFCRLLLRLYCTVVEKFLKNIRKCIYEIRLLASWVKVCMKSL